MIEEYSGEAPSAPLKNSSGKLRNDRLNVLKIQYFFMLLLGASLGIYSWYVWDYTNCQAMNMLTLCCGVAVVGGLLGLIGTFRTLRSPEGKIEADYILVVSFYFIVGIFGLFLVFGTRALFYSERYLSYFDMISEEDEGWRSQYDGKSLEEVKAVSILMISIAGYTSYFIVVLCGIMMYFVYVLGVMFNVIHYVLHVVSLGGIVIGLEILILAGYCLKLREDMELYSYIGIEVLISMVILGLSIQAISVFGVISNQKEKYIKLYATVCCVIIVICVLSSIAVIRTSRKLEKKMTENCVDILGMVDEEYLANEGCKEKYTEIALAEHGLSCAKAEIRYVWESTYESTVYGCLNTNCCSTLIAENKTRFDFLEICAVTAAFLLGIAVWGFYYFYLFIDKIQERSRKGEKALTIFIVLLIGYGLFYLIFGLPKSPGLAPFKEAKVTVIDATNIDDRYIYPSFCLQLEEIPLESNCDECDFRADVYSDDGPLFYDGVERNPIEINTESIKKMKKQLGKVKYCPLCEFELGAYSVQVLQKSIKSSNYTTM